MTKQTIDAPESDLPAGIGAPARRALAGAGIVRLAQCSTRTEAEILRLHGMGPKAMGILRAALAANGLSFAARDAHPDPSHGGRE